MLRAPLLQACLVLFVGLAMGAPARAQDAASPGRVRNLALPQGPGVTAEPVIGRQSQFLLDLIRRTYNTAQGRTNLEHDPAVRSLLTAIDEPGRSGRPHSGSLPLPLPSSVWIDTVFGGRETPRTLLSALMRSRGPALLYYGLFSLDDDTRAWLASQPELIAELAGQHSPAFVVAAPGLRVRGSAISVPGGEAARPAWESLVGHDTGDAARFTRALLTRDEGRLAFFFGAMAQLTPGQLRVAFSLDAPDAAVRVAAARRLRDVFERLTHRWRVDAAVFWRPAVDPALLIASLRRDDAGLPVVPGTRPFWTSVFGDAQHPAGSAAAANAPAVDFSWLSEQVFRGDKDADRRRYDVVLLVSRLQPRNARWSGAEAVAALRAAQRYPALTVSLERARLVDVAPFDAAAARAESITAIRDAGRARRTLAQFQGALALVLRVASRGGMRPDALASAVTSLSAVELSDRGDYEGRLVRWLAVWLEAQRRDRRGPELDLPHAGPMEQDALAVLAGPSTADPRFVEWEGTRYRLDFALAEGTRIARLLGEQPRPFLSSAQALVAMSDAIASGRLSPAEWRQHSSAFEEIATAVAWDPADGWEQTGAPGRYRESRNALRRAGEAAKVRDTTRLVSTLLALADDLAARGLMELAYAVALGQPERTSILADAAARRHHVPPKIAGLPAPEWQLPWPATTSERGWHVSGSLLGLDVRLADYALVPLSSRPPARKPTMISDQRRILTEAVALVDPGSLQDVDRTAIVAAMQKGRARVAAARTAEDVVALADEIRLSPARRTLLAWVISADPEALPALLSLSELLWLGLEGSPVAERLHAWGAPAAPRTGCMCLEILDRQPWETLAGRLSPGVLTSGFPDLNLRLAELLEELQMPAALLAPVLAAATLDLVQNALPRDGDDRQALLDFVHSLRRERVEQYLALLTADGPLVPVESGAVR